MTVCGESGVGDADGREGGGGCWEEREENVERESEREEGVKHGG